MDPILSFIDSFRLRSLANLFFCLVFAARVMWELDSFGLVNKLTRTLRVCVWEPTLLVTPIQIETLLGTHRLEPTHQTTHAPHASQSLFLFQPSGAGNAHCFSTLHVDANGQMLKIYRKRNNMVLVFHVFQVASPHAIATIRYRNQTLSRTLGRPTTIDCTDHFLLMT